MNSRQIKIASRKTELLKRNISEKITQSDQFPDVIVHDGRKVELEYTLDEKLQTQLFHLLDSYRPDYGVVVVMDNKTGEIVGAIGYSGKERKVNQSLIFNSQNPAASIFKIITSASLLQTQEVDIDTEIFVKGRGTTLYKYQLKDYENKKWARKITLNKAFALSNNVAFGKLAIKNLESSRIDKLAESFYFNKDLMSDIQMPVSNYRSPSSQYNLAEVASGFNKSTTLNPIHAAFLASVIANSGLGTFPKLVSDIKVDSEEWDVQHSPEQRIIEQPVAHSISEMMLETVHSGTARKSFRPFLRKYRDRIEVGGKTGSISGGEPEGKRDWFVAFAKQKYSADKGISLSVMLVNQKKWKVKSTYLASRIIEYYYGQIHKESKVLTKLEERAGHRKGI